MELTQTQIIRMLSEMIQFGTIVEVQAKPLRYKVRFDEKRTSDWLRSDVGHAAQVRDWHPLQEGEQVIVLKPFDTLGGVIVASLNQTQFDQPKDNLQLYYREFSDGTWLQYDMENHLLSGEVKGKVDLIAKEQFRVESPKIVLVGDIEHDGDQKTTGNIDADGEVSDGVRSMNEDRNIFNIHPHKHGSPLTSPPEVSQ